jgi:hypothetical protein
MQEAARDPVTGGGTLSERRKEYRLIIWPVLLIREFNTASILSISWFSFVCPSLVFREWTLLLEKKEMFELGPKISENYEGGKTKKLENLSE